MSPVRIYEDLSNVWIMWSLPSIRGSNIDKYLIKLQKYGDTYSEYPLLCDGQNSTVVAIRECLIPMTAFTTTLAYPLG